MRFAFMRLKCIRVLPHREHCEMVGTRRDLLKYIVPDVAFVIPALLGQTFEQHLSFIFTRWRYVDVRHNAKRISGGLSGGRTNSETVMHTLIIGAAVDCSEFASELYRLLRPFKVVEGRLIFTGLNNRKPVWPTGFPKDLDTRTSSFCAAFTTQDEQRDPFH